MAKIVYKDKTSKLLTEEQATKLWRAKNNQINLTNSQKERLGMIDRIYLDYYSAPEAYVNQNMSWIAAIEVSRWSVDSQGALSRPVSARSWDFARKYGLWSSGGPTGAAQAAFAS